MRARDFKQLKKDLIIFDIDDTLLHTTAKIRVVKDGETVRELTNQQFNQYELQSGEEFDFGEFRSAEKFNQESKPIEPMINKLKTILAHSKNSEVIMLTARSDFDNRDLFLKTFTDLGIDMSRVHVHRAGNLPGDEIPAEKKAVYVRKYAETRKYDHIRLYDDSMSNLRVFKGLEDEYPDIDFRAYYVGPKGQTQNIAENISISDHKDNFVEMFQKFLPIAMKHIGLKNLPTMKFESHVHDDVQPTFGKYENGERVLYVSLMNRHPNDILRTIAHELTHYKQDSEHELVDDSGRTGSPHENQANAVAGIVMRHFNKQYPEYLSSKPITEGITPKDIHKLADKNNIPWDNEPSFLKLTKRLTGKEHLDDLDQTELQKVKHHLEIQCVTESFDQPYPFRWEANKNRVKAIATLNDGSNLIIRFDHDDEGNWQVVFDRNDDFEVTGGGDAQRVFATVLTAINQFVKNHKPLSITFSASKDVDTATANPESRAKLYNRLVQRYASSMGYKSHSREVNDEVIYLLRPTAVTTENFADGKGPGRPGDSVRHGIPKKATMAELEKASHAKGRKGQLARWQINMRNGKKKS